MRAKAAELPGAGYRLAQHALTAVRVSYGALLLAAPAQAVRLCPGAPATALSPLARRTTRLLGIRHLAQAALTARVSQDRTAIGSAVDVVHAASMVLLATADRRLREVVLTDATAESILAIAGAVLAALAPA